MVTQNYSKAYQKIPEKRDDVSKCINNNSPIRNTDYIRSTSHTYICMYDVHTTYIYIFVQLTRIEHNGRYIT